MQPAICVLCLKVRLDYCILHEKYVKDEAREVQFMSYHQLKLGSTAFNNPK